MLHTRRRSGLASGHGTDTDNTPERLCVGGLAKYSHGVYNLVHQHWTLQLESAGGFNVNDTEAAESYHRQCMTLPAERVRHRGTPLETYVTMQKYLLHRLLFRTLRDRLPEDRKRERTVICALGKLLRQRIGNHWVPVAMGNRLRTVEVQTRVLHPQVRIARGELLDLVCDKVALPRTATSYTKLENLRWNFGQKLTMPDGNVYWATDSEYSFSTHGRRRDNFLLAGTSKVDVRLPSGEQVERDTALCCQAICFIILDNIQAIHHDNFPHDLDIVNDRLTLALVRWFQAHPSATERNSSCLPLCPPPFNINHALWKYAVSDSHRNIFLERPVQENESLQPSQAFHTQTFMFGRNTCQARRTLRNEAYAYYALIEPSSIDSLAYMSAEFAKNATHQTSTWLQTITFPI